MGGDNGIDVTIEGACLAMKKQKDYVPQTKSRKNIESDITPQSIKKSPGLK